MYVMFCFLIFYIQMQYAVAIKTALRSYQAVRVLVTPELEPLVMPQLLEIRELISEAFDVKLSGSTAVSKKQRVRWETKELPDWVSRLTASVSKFEDRVEQLLRACDKVDIALNLMEEVGFTHSKFQGVLGSIQKTIDEMSLSGYNDLDSWVRVVGDKMAGVLAIRLENALKGWNRAFRLVGKDEDGEEKKSEDYGDEDLPQISIPTTLELEIVLRNQEISAFPSIPAVRALLLEKLHEYFGIVCSLPRPKSGRYEVFDTITAKPSDTGGKEAIETFENVVQLVNPNILSEAYASIERHVKDASDFVDQWLAYQTLWDTSVSEVAATVGHDIRKWQDLLIEAAEARSTLDSSANVAKYGPILIKYGKVQSQIILKYDSWQKELQASFAAILGQRVIETHEMINGAKTKLEATALDSTSTENIVLGVTFIQEVKQKSTGWSKDIEHLRSAEKLLRKQRHIFHGDWMETSVLKGIFDSTLQILERRVRTMDQQVPLLQARVTAEDKAAAKQLVSLLEDWDQNKPLRGNKTPQEAMEVLTKYEINMKKAHLRKLIATSCFT